MNEFDYMAQNVNEDRAVTPHPFLRGFCQTDPMFRGVFDMAYSTGIQAFSDQVTTRHEDSSQTAFETL